MKKTLAGILVVVSSAGAVLQRWRRAKFERELWREATAPTLTSAR